MEVAEVALATGWTMNQVQEHSSAQLIAYAEAQRRLATLRRLQSKGK